MTPEQIQAMPQEELAQLLQRASDAGTGPFNPNQPEVPTAEAPAASTEAAPQTTLNTAEFGDLAGDLADVTSQLNAATTAAQITLRQNTCVWC